MLSIGDQIPTKTTVLDKDNNEVSLDKFLDKKYLVLYFYPKDQTEGCTEEACSFRDNNEVLEKLDAHVVGISCDNQKSHGKFIAKESLNFQLLSDETHKLQEDFGIWAEKSMFGKTYMGTLRTTYLVDKSGEILEIWGPNAENKVTTKTHAEDVAARIKSLL
ncbi:MAG: thioredoxin-dependent thiol peroxidase [Candidatus Dojkabacteria bacterium]